ncbi:MAG: helix-turn-helix domain-containing protein [Desulfobacteraceae bacterium]|nr:helix-turn-helix domain-containing protein [Desulfobacteraceae bacterium]
MGKHEPRNGIRKRLLTARDIAYLMQISKSKAYDLMRSGEIPAVRIGRSIRVREEDIDQYIEDHLEG